MRRLGTFILLLACVPAQGRNVRTSGGVLAPLGGRAGSNAAAAAVFDGIRRVSPGLMCGNLRSFPVSLRAGYPRVEPSLAPAPVRPTALAAVPAGPLGRAAFGVPAAQARPLADRPAGVDALASLDAGLRNSRGDGGGEAAKTLGDSFFDGAKPAAPSDEQTAGVKAVLEPGTWLPENRARLESIIREYGRGGPRWDPDRPPLATFDWDNTMIVNDVGEALLYYLIREMRFKFELGDRFWSVIPKELGRDAIRANYETIKDMPLAEAKQTPAYRRYRKLFHLAYEQAQARAQELHLDFGWLVELMTGFTVEEAEAAAEETIALELARPLGEELVREDASDRHPVRIRTGLRPYAEMFDLAAKLQAAGWEVRIVTGSNEWTVARFAARAGILRANVHGVLARLADGRLTGEIVQRSWGKGKADVILEKAGRPGLLAAGDSVFDVEMLRLSAGEKLLIDRGNDHLRSMAKAEGWMLQPPFPSSVGSKPKRFKRAPVRWSGLAAPL